MYPALIQRVLRRSALAAAIAASAIVVTAASDWPEWRGPSRDGRSSETNLPAKWSPKGENPVSYTHLTLPTILRV